MKMLNSTTPPPSYNNAVLVETVQHQRRSSSQSSATVQPHVFTLSLHGDDRIRLSFSPPDVSNIIQDAIKDFWGSLKTVTVSDNGAKIEFKLEGNPWSMVRIKDEAIRSRRLMSGIIQNLARGGWNLLQASEITKKFDGTDVSVLFFENCLADHDARIFAVNFSKLDRIRVISAPTSCVGAVEQAIDLSWSRGIRTKKTKTTGYFEFALNGIPWFMGARLDKCRLLAQLCMELRKNGYKLHASVKLTKKKTEMPTWYFRKITHVYS